MNDPQKLILNVAVTGDVVRAEATLRQTWGGALCVSSSGHTRAELRRVRRDVEDSLEGEANVLFARTDLGRVHLEVVYDEGALQQALDQRYPGGVVVVSSALRPYRP